MSYMNSKGNTQRYDYLFCLGRHRKSTTCKQKVVHSDAAEAAVEDVWRMMTLNVEMYEQMRRLIEVDLEDDRREAAALRRQYTAKLAALRTKQQRLLDAYVEGGVVKELMLAKQSQLQDEISLVAQKLNSVAADLERAERVVELGADFARNVGEAYTCADDSVRRQFNQAVFERLYLGPEGVVRCELTEELAPFVHVRGTPATVTVTGTNEKGPTEVSGAFLVQGLNVNHLVELRGIEPLTSSMPWKRSAN